MQQETPLRSSSAASSSGPASGAEVHRQWQSRARESTGSSSQVLTRDALHKAAQGDSLMQQLSLKEAELKEQSDATSSVADSEERDKVCEDERAALEERSQRSGGASSDSASGPSSGRRHPSSGSGSHGSGGSHPKSTDGAAENNDLSKDSDGNSMGNVRTELRESQKQTDQMEQLAIQRKQQMAGMHAQHEHVVQDLWQELADSKQLSDEAVDNADDLRDEIEELRARHTSKMEQVELQIESELKSSSDKEKVAMAEVQLAMEEQVKANTNVHDLTHRNLQLLNKQKVAEEQFQQTSTDFAAFRRNVKATQIRQRNEIDGLRELIKSQLAKLAPTQSNADSTDGDGSQQHTTQAQSDAFDLGSVSQMLLDSRASQHDISGELADLQLHVQSIQKDHADEVLSLQQTIDDANVELQAMSKGSKGQRQKSQRTRGKGVRGRSTNPSTAMPTINEDGEDDASLDGLSGRSGSGAVSDSDDDGRGPIANLEDFDDDDVDFPSVEEDWGNSRSMLTKGQVEALEQERNSMQVLLSAERATNKRLHEEQTLNAEQKAGDDAGSDAKQKRLKGKLTELKEGSRLDKKKLAALQAERTGQDARHQAQVFDLEKARSHFKDQIILLEDENIELKRQLSEKTAQIHDLSNQLCYAIEAQKMSDSRLEDYKIEIESLGKRHEATVEALKYDLKLCRASGSQEEGSRMSVHSDMLLNLREKLRSAENDNRMLEHSIDWKEVQWKNQLETLEINHETTLAEVKHSNSLSSVELNCGLECQISELREALNTANATATTTGGSDPSTSGTGEAKAPAATMAPQSALEAVPQVPSPSPVGAALSGLLRGLRCPPRSNVVTGAVRSSVPGVPDAAHCQGVVWDVLNAVPGVNGMLCSIPDLLIMEATKTACKLWGSARLHGQGLLSLVSSEIRGKSLQRALNSTSMLGAETPGFFIKDLQCMEMSLPMGQSFDASIFLIRLPAEPPLGKMPAAIVVVEALTVDLQPHNRDGPRKSPSSYQSDSQSVSPSDSVSCVAEKNQALQYCFDRR